jgi:hypothetical protein
LVSLRLSLGWGGNERVLTIIAGVEMMISYDYCWGAEWTLLSSYHYCWGGNG